MQNASPWTLGSSTDQHGRPKAGHQPVHSKILDPIIYLCAESIRICAILLQPVMPGRMDHALNLMGAKGERRMLKDAVVGADRDFGVPMTEVGEGRKGVVFPQLRSEF